MKKIIRKCFIFGLTLALLTTVASGDVTLYGKFFFDYHINRFLDSKTYDATNKQLPQFAFERAILGGKIEKELYLGVLSFNTTVDIAHYGVKTGDDFDFWRWHVYLKKAAFKWGVEDTFGLTLGLQSTDFSFAEDIWGHRHIAKTATDAWKFGPTTDLGVSAEVRLFGPLWLQAFYANGDGYNKPQLEETQNYGTSLRVERLGELPIILHGASQFAPNYAAGINK